MFCFRLCDNLQRRPNKRETAEDVREASRMTPPAQLTLAVVFISLLDTPLCLHTDQWGETHQRAEADLDTVVVLPSSSGETPYNLGELPKTKDWGLVEINSDTDLTQAEFSR